MDNGCVLYFTHLAFSLRTELILFYNGECQRGVSPSLSVKKRSLVLASNVLATSVYSPNLDILISIIVFGSINQKLESKGTEFLLDL